MGNFGFEPRYILAINQQGQQLGVTFCDVGTARISVGQFTDDLSWAKLRTLVA